MCGTCCSGERKLATCCLLLAESQLGILLPLIRKNLLLFRRRLKMRKAAATRIHDTIESIAKTGTFPLLSACSLSVFSLLHHPLFCLPACEFHRKCFRGGAFPDTRLFFCLSGCVVGSVRGFAFKIKQIQRAWRTFKALQRAQTVSA